ncbi:LSU ribosomal protein L10p (P0) [Clostridiaceae bacterium JG1575]|nr:LSU ribosomal protein L10p (P0) [Clostridiaceae bacterium JG1575]
MSNSIREQKEQVVSEIKELINASKSLVVVNYQGINVEDDTALRKTMRENNVQYKVLKNTMVELAMADRDAEAFKAFLDGPNAFAFGEDEVTAAKLIKTFMTEKKKLEIKGGFVDGHVYGADEIKALADMPSKEELIAKLLGSMQNPISKVVRVLHALSPSTKFTYMVKALADQKAEAGEA